ncbi:MAG: endolytic transglycosylase MltG [Cyclobacteriaceae bacterium]|nr:endolytic transglycosylase MltG [Cyclobacteriaceae bacterium]
MKRNGSPIKLYAFILVSVLLITFTFYAYQICYTPNILVGKEDHYLYIPPDATFATVQKSMHENGYVQDLISFSFLSRLMDYDKRVRPGRYLLRANMTNIQAIRFLRSGEQEPVHITFNNIRLINDLAPRITQNILITPEEFEAALAGFLANGQHGFTSDNIICMFIPNTYEVYYTISAKQLVERMHDEYERFWNEERKQKAAAIGLTPVQVSVLASIVQAESVKRDEAPVIAGLYLNRLRQGIALQADPTLVFAVGDFTLKRVLDKHKEVESPYNTYKYRGLPPGPINMPEIFTIDAVLNYKPSNFLYMCAKEDFSGYHNFTASYSEHLKNASRYQQALTREQRIARANQNKK